MSILIKNGRVIDPKNNIDAILDILVVNGKIAELNKNLDSKKAKQIIDAAKKIVMPGIIDLQLNLFIQNCFSSNGLTFNVCEIVTKLVRFRL